MTTSMFFRLWTRTPRATIGWLIALPGDGEALFVEGGRDLLLGRGRGGLLRRLAEAGLQRLQRGVDLALLADGGQLAVEVLALRDRDGVHGGQAVGLLLDRARGLVEHGDRPVDVVLVGDGLHAALRLVHGVHRL